MALIKKVYENLSWLFLFNQKLDQKFRTCLRHHSRSGWGGRSCRWGINQMCRIRFYRIRIYMINLFILFPRCQLSDWHHLYSSRFSLITYVCEFIWAYSLCWSNKQRIRPLFPCVFNTWQFYKKVSDALLLEWMIL